GLAASLSATAPRRKLAPGRYLRRDTDRELAIAVREGRGIDFLELDGAAHHALLPGVVLGIVLELAHHLSREQLQRLADMFMRVLAGGAEQDHLVDMRAAEAPQLFPDRLG